MKMGWVKIVLAIRNRLCIVRDMKAQKKVYPLFDIVARWNSLTGKFVKGERLTVNVIKHPCGLYRGEYFYQVNVTNAAGLVVNKIMNVCATKKTAVNWAIGNFAHERIAA